MEAKIEDLANCTEKMAGTIQSKGQNNTIVAVFLIILMFLIFYTMYSKEKTVNLLVSSYTTQQEKSYETLSAMSKAIETNTLVMKLAVSDLNNTYRSKGDEIVGGIAGLCGAQKEDTQVIIDRVEYAREHLEKIICRKKKESEKE